MSLRLRILGDVVSEPPVVILAAAIALVLAGVEAAVPGTLPAVEAEGSGAHGAGLGVLGDRGAAAQAGDGRHGQQGSRAGRAA